MAEHSSSGRSIQEAESVGFLRSPHLFQLGLQPRAWFCSQSVLYWLSSVSTLTVELNHLRAGIDSLHMELGGEFREPRGTESGAVHRWAPVET